LIVQLFRDGYGEVTENFIFKAIFLQRKKCLKVNPFNIFSLRVKMNLEGRWLVFKDKLNGNQRTLFLNHAI